MATIDAASLFFDTQFQAFGDDGAAVALGTVLFTRSDNGAEVDTYKTAQRTAMNTRPVVLSASGKADIYVDNGQYTVVVKDSNDLTVRTIEDFSPAISSTEDFATNFALALADTTPVIYRDTIANMLLIDGELFPTVNVQAEGVGGIFNYDDTQVAVNNGVTIFDGWVRQDLTPINVKWAGAKGDGIEDEIVAIQAALDIGGDIFFPEGDYNLSAAVVPISNSTIYGEKGARIIKSDAGTDYDLFDNKTGTLNNITVRDLEFVGSGVASGVSFGINFQGTSSVATTAPVRITNITVKDCQFSLFQSGGMYIRYAKNFYVLNNLVTDCRVYGILIGSGSIGVIKNNIVKRITETGSGYGIIMTSSWDAGSDTVRFPRSQDIVCSDNYVEEVTNWTGIDTHGGLNIKILDNTILGCHYGIGMGKVDSGGSGNMFTTSNSIADGNYVVGTVSFFGLGISGTSAIKGYDNKIINNTFVSCGNEASVDGAALYVNHQEGTLISGNTFNECAIEGIQIDSSDNFICTENTIKDVYSDIGTARCIDIENNSKGVINNNRAIRVNSGLGTSVTEVGLRVSDATGLVLDDNDFEEAVTPYEITAGMPLVYPTSEVGQDTSAASTGASYLDVVIPLRRKLSANPVNILASSNRGFGGVGIISYPFTQTTTTITIRHATVDGSNFASAYNIITYYQTSGY